MDRSARLHVLGMLARCKFCQLQTEDGRNFASSTSVDPHTFERTLAHATKSKAKVTPLSPPNQCWPRGARAVCQLAKFLPVKRPLRETRRMPWAQHRFWGVQGGWPKHFGFQDVAKSNSLTNIGDARFWVRANETQFGPSVRGPSLGFMLWKPNIPRLHYYH